MVQALGGLNRAFARLAASLGTDIQDSLWSGSLDSEAGSQLKWVYPASADDSEFLKRATLASTLIIEALKPKLRRKLLQSLDETLHQNNEGPAWAARLPATSGASNACCNTDGELKARYRANSDPRKADRG